MFHSSKTVLISSAFICASLTIPAVAVVQKASVNPAKNRAVAVLPADTKPGPPTPETAPEPVPSKDLSAFAVFSPSDIKLAGSAKVNGGLVGTNSDLQIAPFSNFKGLVGGGALYFDNTGGGVTNDGDILFNKGVALGQDFTLNGDINTGGDVTVNDRPKFVGNINAGGSVLFNMAGTFAGKINAGRDFQIGDFMTLTGDVNANRAASVGGTLVGTLTAASLVLPFPGKIDGTKTQGNGTNVFPIKSYTPYAIPPPDTFKTGNVEITAVKPHSKPLPPGHYDSLIMPDFTTVNLVPGDYYFKYIETHSTATIALNNLTSKKGIHVFVANYMELGPFLRFTINGSAYDHADWDLAKKVFWEVQGPIRQTAGSSEWFGTIFTPNGPLTLANYDKMAGTLISKGPIEIGTGFELKFEPCAKFGPAVR